MIIQVNYVAKWQLIEHPHYKWTECKKLINCKTGNEIKKTIKGIQSGYWIGKEFIKLSDLINKIELIPIHDECPF